MVLVGNPAKLIGCAFWISSFRTSPSSVGYFDVSKSHVETLSGFVFRRRPRHRGQRQLVPPEKIASRLFENAVRNIDHAARVRCGGRDRRDGVAENLNRCQRREDRAGNLQLFRALQGKLTLLLSCQIPRYSLPSMFCRKPRLASC